MFFKPLPESPPLSYASSPAAQVYPKYRADIDGLRAIAVLSVVGFHAFPNLVKGGFVGVDIFFVISGFLISGIIINNVGNGSFSFADFYARRIKRIFPALILVMSACYVLGWLALFPDEYKQLGKHILGGAGFFANFILWKEVDYFDNEAVTKPLLHLWSLGIEEQFYIVWPLLLFVAWKRRLSLLTLIVVVALVSFAINIAGVHRDAAAAFYSPISRFWELLMGGGLAYLQFQKNGVMKIAGNGGDIASLRVSPAWRNIQAALGIALIGSAVFLFNKTQPFPGWRAVIPTLGTCLLISANSTAWVNRVLLSSRILVWIGVISYPLYLWHWPLLSFAHIVESGVVSAEVRFAAVAFAVLLAWLTYVLIERPIRFGNRVPAKVKVLCVLTIMLGAVGYNTYQREGLIFRSTVKTNTGQQQAFVWKDDKNIQDACIKQYPVYGRYCLQTALDKPPTVALIGDSHANHLFFGLAAYYQKRGENLLLLGERLPFWNVETGPPGTEATFVRYKEIMNNILDRVANTDSIRTIILASAGVPYLANPAYHLKLATKPGLKNHEKIFEEAMRETLRQLVKTGKKIIFVIDIPELGFDPKSCVDDRPLRLTTRVRAPCAIEKSAFDQRTANYHKIVNDILQDFPMVQAFPAYKDLCDENYCWAMRNGKMLYRDDNHLSHEGSLYIGSQFELGR